VNRPSDLPLRIVLSHVYCWPEVRRGAERYVHELAAALTWLGHDVCVLSSAEHTARWTELGVPVTAFGRGRLDARSRATGRQQVRFASRATAQVLAGGADVWHANSLYDGAAATCAAKLRPRLRSVFTLHGPSDPVALGRRPQRQAFALVRRADALVCVSEPAAAQLRTTYGAAALVIPPGVDTTAFTPGGLRSAHPVVLYVGALTSRRKNIALLLEAAALALDDQPSLEVWLAGQGDPTPLIDAAPSGIRSRVRNLGPLEGDALLDAYRSAWVTALVSEREVFGMVVVESLACGTPAVVLDDGWGPAQIVQDDVGVRSAATPDALAGALLAGLGLSCRPGSATRCREVAATYDWRTHVAPRLVEVYRDGA
jgi:glycosyltransferase involved in cell wall biosynthesis